MPRQQALTGAAASDGPLRTAPKAAADGDNGKGRAVETVRTGLTISLAGHGLLLAAILAGEWWMPRRPPPELTITDIAVVSEAELAARTLAAPALPPAPQPAAPAPFPTREEAPPTRPRIEAAPAPASTPQASPAQLAADRPPEAVTPPPLPADVTLPEKPEIGRSETAETGPLPPRPTPGESDRIPEGPAGSPDMLAALDEGPRFVPKVDLSTPRPEKPPTAEADVAGTRPETEALRSRKEAPSAPPEEAAPTPVAEADAGLGRLAPARSMRPRGRPPLPPQETVAAKPAERQPPAAAPVATIEALLAQAEAEAGSATTSARALPAPRPSLDPGNVEQLRSALRRCWNTGALGEEARRITVTLRVRFSPDGRVDPGAISLVGISPGSDRAQRTAYETAKRAVILCQNDFDLPADRYEAWREMEITFDLARMGIQ